MRLKKRTICGFAFCLFMILLFAIAGCAPNNENDGTTDLRPESQEADEYGDFADNLVGIVLTREATLQFLDYTPEDFSEVGAVKVKELSSWTVDWVRKKLQGIPTHQEALVNIDKYRRIFSIELPQHDKRKVLEAVEILNQREDIEVAEPSYAMHIW
ncbi:MAG: hypothetical protein K2N74_04655 [Clostridiales bacterium]|nr:hypothetical protein [Clostridiales bacterium]